MYDNTTLIYQNWQNKANCTFNDSTTLEEISRQDGNASLETFTVRDLFKDFFNSPSGSVSWQKKCVIGYLIFFETNILWMLSN